MDGQNTISQLYREDLMPLIEEIFDKVDITGKHLRIDHLEIDAGRIAADHFEELKEKIKKELYDKLLKIVQETQPNSGSNELSTKDSRANDSTTQSEKLSNRDSSTEQSADQPEESLSQDGMEDEPVTHSTNAPNIELFIFFVKTGQRPWWANREQLQSLEELALDLIDSQPKPMQKTLDELLPNAQYRNRLIQQFSDEVLEKFIALKVQNKNAEKLKILHQYLSTVHRQNQIVPLNSANFRLALWKSAFTYWYIQSGKRDSATESVIPKLSEVPSKALQHYALYLVKVLVSLQIEAIGSESDQKPENNERRFIQTFTQHISESELQNGWFGKVLSTLEKLPDDEFNEVLQESSSQKAEYDDHRDENLLTGEDRFEVHNAGLVLIAVFLLHFFDNLGLTEENEFITDEAAKRAALILEYVVTRETEAPEYELLLNKLLCGLPADEPLPASIEISETEEEEIDNLLNSVIEHWTALKNTSPEGLRQTFLTKDGLLSREANGWKLTVERKTVDVLVDKIPWTLSVIKLPWNDHLIHVDW